MLERVVKYGFHWTELNNFKASLTQGLVKRYIEKVLIPDLLKQGWSQVIFSNAWFGDEVEQNKKLPEHCRIFWNFEERFFVRNGLHPTKDLLKSLKKLTKTLENVPDGFLFKLRKTGKTKLWKDSMKELGLPNGHWIVDGYNYDPSEHNVNEELTIVKGEIEIVEVKTGKAIIPSHQMISYRKVLQEGYVLHFFHVNIISFEDNKFEIEEKLVTTPEELEIVQKKERKRSSIHKT